MASDNAAPGSTGAMSATSKAVVAAKPPVSTSTKKPSAAEEMEREWQEILEYYEPDNIEKRELERARKELEARTRVTAEQKERNEVLENFYGIKPKEPPRFDPEEEAGEGEPLEEHEREQWDFPDDKDGWKERDLGEEWADPPPGAKTSFYDPILGVTPGEDKEDEEEDDDQRRRRRGQKKAARKPQVLPHSADRFVPYRVGVPPLPDWKDLEEEQRPLAVLEEMDMEEEFLQWASYVFRDGSTYEGTVWNDLAQGKGVYTTPAELCKYEGEWVQNRMEGHGVLSVDVPTPVPPPDTEGWNKLKEEGKLDGEEGMGEFDKQWLKMELEDLTQQAKEAAKDPAIEDPTDAVPFEDNPAWAKAFGRMPEKGHYEYAGQMKYNKFHGCGVLTVNGRMHFGKFRFGDILSNKEECDAHMSGFHAGLARVAAAKARMFVNKPDGMVREVKGPYNDPSHPYLYDDEDMWQAPGFANEFYQPPKVWAKYVGEVDKERESWLNSFYKAPLRLPMPSELSYLWDKEDEFVVLRNEARFDDPVTDEGAVMAHPLMRGEVLLHVPSRQVINWAKDPSGQLRFFIQPISKDGTVDPSQVKVLPLGFDEFLADKQPGGDEDGGDTAQGVPKTAAEQLRDFEQRRAKIAQRRQRRQEAADRERKEQWEGEQQEREGDWARQDEAAEELQAMEEAEWERENELMEDVFEARLDALAGLPDGAGEQAVVVEKGVLPPKGPGDVVSAELEAKKAVEAAKVGVEADLIGKEEVAAEVAKQEVQAEEREAEDEEEEEEEEVESKPRSFGTVVPGQGGGAAAASGGGSKPPAAFASLTLGSEAAFGQMAGALGQWWSRHSGKCPQQPIPSITQNEPLQQHPRLPASARPVSRTLGLRQRAAARAPASAVRASQAAQRKDQPLLVDAAGTAWRQAAVAVSVGGGGPGAHSTLLLLSLGYPPPQPEVIQSTAC